MPHRYLSDPQALDLIAREMSGERWSSDTLNVIADYVRGTGRTIAEPKPLDIEAQS